MGTMDDLSAMGVERQPLYSEEAEQAVLGALLRDGEIGSGAWDRMSGQIGRASCRERVWRCV